MGSELARRRLAWAGLPSPRCLIPAEQVQQGKPSPEGYLRAAAELAVDAARCAVIEDSPAGIEAARGAGMSVVGVTTTHHATQLTGVEVAVRDLVGIGILPGAGEMLMRIEKRTRRE